MFYAVDQAKHIFSSVLTSHACHFIVMWVSSITLQACVYMGLLVSCVPVHIIDWVWVSRHSGWHNLTCLESQYTSSTGCGWAATQGDTTWRVVSPSTHHRLGVGEPPLRVTQLNVSWVPVHIIDWVWVSRHSEWHNLTYTRVQLRGDWQTSKQTGTHYTCCCVSLDVKWFAT